MSQETLSQKWRRQALDSGSASIRAEVLNQCAEELEFANYEAMAAISKKLLAACNEALKFCQANGYGRGGVSNNMQQRLEAAIAAAEGRS